MNADERRLRFSGLKLIYVHLCLSAVPLFLSTGCGALDQLGNTGKTAINFMTGNTPIKAAVEMNRGAADQRRDGVVKLVDQGFGRRPPYTDRYREMAQLDTDWLVRATAIRALNRSRDESAAPLFVRALTDESPIVRTEAAKALVNVPEPSAAPALLRLATNPEENRDVRIWATDALKHYRTNEVARALIAMLNIRDFGVSWQAHRSLTVITGNDFRFDEAAWLQHLSTSERPFG